MKTFRILTLLRAQVSGVLLAPDLPEDYRAATAFGTEHPSDLEATMQYTHCDPPFAFKNPVFSSSS